MALRQFGGLLVEVIVAAAALSISSPAFTGGDNIPSKFSCDAGQTNPSPALSWKDATTSLPENFQPGSVGVSGNSGFRRGGYGGPCPPSGSHHCHFMLSALDVPTLGLQAGASKADVEKAMRMSLPNSRRRATHGARDRSRRRRSIGRSSCRSA